MYSFCLTTPQFGPVSGRAAEQAAASGSEEVNEDDSEEEYDSDGEGSVSASDQDSDDEMLDIEKKAKALDEDRCCSDAGFLST